MKTLYITLFLLCFIFSNIYSQYGFRKIYSDDTSGKGIVTMNSIKMSAGGLNQIYIQRGISYPNGNPNTSGQYLKLNRQNTSWYVPLNGFANAGWCLCTCPFTCNPPVFVCNRVLLLIPSPVDTAFAFKNLIGGCGCDAGDAVLYTTNNGINFVNLPQFGNDFLGQACFGIDIDPVNDAISYIGYPIIGQNYKVIYKSTNRGNTWIPVDTNSQFFRYLKINPLKRTNIFCGGSGQMLLSTNSGTDFFPVGGQAFYEMKFCYADSTIYGMAFNGIYKSTNNGFNWAQVWNINALRCIEVSPENSNIAYAGNNMGLYRTTNGGLNWVLYNDRFSPSKTVIGISKDVSSGDNVIVATTDAVYRVWGSFVDIKNITYEIPDKFELSQNYPNPFNPATHIGFRIADLGLVKLTIYDVLGNEIMVIVKQEMQPGSYEVEWDASAYPSGVYYYKLESSSFTETKKMVLIK